MTNASLYDIEEWHLLAYKQCLFCCIINNFPFLLLKLLSNAPYHDQLWRALNINEILSGWRYQLAKQFEFF